MVLLGFSKDHITSVCLRGEPTFDDTIALMTFLVADPYVEFAQGLVKATLVKLHVPEACADQFS